MRLLPLLALIVGLVGCDTSTVPEDVEVGAYELGPPSDMSAWTHDGTLTLDGHRYVLVIKRVGQTTPELTEAGTYTTRDTRPDKLLTFSETGIEALYSNGYVIYDDRSGTHRRWIRKRTVLP